MQAVRVTLCPSVELYLTAEGDLYLLPADPAGQLLVAAPLGRPLHQLLRSLGPGAILPPICADPERDDEETLVADAAWDLLNRDILRPAADVQLDPLFDRQQRYFAQRGLNATRAQAALADSVVLVLGLGGVGGAAADLLVRHGVGTLVGIDHDAVALENLPRQSLFAPADVGRPKIEAARERLVNISTCTTVRCMDACIGSASDVERLIRRAGPSIVLSTIDSPPGVVTDWVDEACFATGVPYTTAAQRPPLVVVGPTCVPGVTACRSCCLREGVDPRTPALRTARARGDFVVPAVGYADHTAATMMVSDVLALLTGAGEPASLGTQLWMDMERASVRRVASVAAHCPRCERASDLGLRAA